MKTIVTREAAARRTARTSNTPHAVTAPNTPKAPDQVWPGFTRAQLRDLVIEQIG